MVWRSGRAAVILASVASGLLLAASGSARPLQTQRSAAEWTFVGKADLHDSGALELKIRSIAGAPRSFDLVRRLLVGRDVLLVGAAPAVDTAGRAVPRFRLDHAIVRLRGTLLGASQWRYDLDGEATPTVRPSRITVLGFSS